MLPALLFVSTVLRFYWTSAHQLTKEGCLLSDSLASSYSSQPSSQFCYTIKRSSVPDTLEDSAQHQSYPEVLETDLKGLLAGGNQLIDELARVTKQIDMLRVTIHSALQHLSTVVGCPQNIPPAPPAQQCQTPPTADKTNGSPPGSKRKNLDTTNDSPQGWEGKEPEDDEAGHPLKKQRRETPGDIDSAIASSVFD